MRLVHREARERNAGEGRGEALVCETLRRDVEKTPPAGERVLEDPLPVPRGHERVNRRRRDAAAGELVHLVLHERDERRDDERRARQHQRRELEAERLAGARGHDGEEIPPRERRPHDLFLARAEGPVAEVTLER